MYGAVDVAITQLMVEILVIVILAVALLKLPRLPQSDRPAGPGVRWLALAGLRRGGNRGDRHPVGGA